VAQDTLSSPKQNGRTEQLGEDQGNDAVESLALERPYTVTTTLKGVCPMLFHRWSNESIAAKAAARKNSAAKKTDDIDSYVYRTSDGEIAIPGEYLKGSIAGPQGAAKYRQDPRSTRKSALDLYKAGVIVLTEFASLGTKNWDYLDERRVMVQRQGITRTRPAMLAGWEATFEILVQTPEYINASELLDVISQAGRLVGLADFRPTYGRFQVIGFDVLGEA
jgi:hypothetical protein